MRITQTLITCVPALMMCIASTSVAQDGSGLNATPRHLVRVGEPLLTIDTDEDAQARRVFNAPRWRAFIETMAREPESSPDPELLVAACRRSIRYARLTGTDLLVDGCIADAIERVDLAGIYTNPRQYASSQRERRRPAGAMGLEILSTKRQGEPLAVVSPIESGPASRAGIRSGDLIESIDDVSTLPLSHEETIDLLRGKPGTVARVKLTRDGTALELSVGREVIRPKVVRVKRVGADVLYVRVSRFLSGLVAAQLLTDLQAALASQPRPKLWIMDLRYNAGGALPEVVATASLFVPAGASLFGVSSRSGVKSYVSTPPLDQPASVELGTAIAGIPLVVLVDGGTGSGAEAFAHVLRERFAAKIVGQPTARIDNVLQRFELLGEAAVQITVGYIVSASGQRRYSEGVPLDLVLSY